MPTPYTILSAIVLAIPAAIFLYYRRGASPSTTTTETKEDSKPIMQPARTDLAPPKDDPFKLDQLREFDGSDPSKPIYVAIKGWYLILCAPWVS